MNALINIANNLSENGKFVGIQVRDGFLKKRKGLRREVVFVFCDNSWKGPFEYLSFSKIKQQLSKNAKAHLDFYKLYPFSDSVFFYLYPNIIIDKIKKSK